jgi:hypothetical protein
MHFIILPTTNPFESAASTTAVTVVVISLDEGKADDGEYGSGIDSDSGDRVEVSAEEEAEDDEYGSGVDSDSGRHKSSMPRRTIRW